MEVMLSHDRCYSEFIRSLKLLKKIHFYNVRGIKGLLYKHYSYKAYKKYTPVDGNDCRTLSNGNNNYIVSLTTYGERINHVHITIDTLLKQTLRPWKLVLCLSIEEFPNGLSDLPMELQKREHGIKWFEIIFCEDLKPHKKYYEPMRRYPEKTIITCDDDVFYPSDWLAELDDLHRSYPECICCTNAHRITMTDTGSIEKYSNWIHMTDETGPSLLLCPIGVGGVLYPPNSLDKRIFDREFIVENCLNADDLWLKTMSLLKRTQIVKTNKYVYTFLNIPQTTRTALSRQNVLQNRNDDQLSNILRVYGDNVIRELTS